MESTRRTSICFLKECEFRFNYGSPSNQFKTLRIWCDIESLSTTASFLIIQTIAINATINQINRSIARC